MLLGPAFAIFGALRFAAVQLVRGNNRGRIAATWTAHLLALGLLTTWLDRRCGIPPVAFAFASVMPRCRWVQSARSTNIARPGKFASAPVINEAAWPWRLLFLNNNYHLVHHDLPHVPWFALREVYETSRQQYIERSGGFLVQGYSVWLRLYCIHAGRASGAWQSVGFHPKESSSVRRPRG